MEERLQVGKATRSTPRIHPSLRALFSRQCENFAYLRIPVCLGSKTLDCADNVM